MKLTHILMMICVTAIWGTNFIAIKISLESFPPFLQLALRFLMVSIPLIFFVRLPRGSWKVIFKFSVFLWILQMSFVNLGLKNGVPAGMFSLLIQLKPMVVLFLSMIFYRYYPKPQEIGGVIVALVGMGIIVITLITDKASLAYFYIIPAILSVSYASLVFKNGICEASPLTITAWCAFITFFPMLFLSLYFEGIDEIQYSLLNCSLFSVIGLVYCVFSTLLATPLYVFLLRFYGPERIVPYNFLTPIFSLIIAYFVYDEQLTLLQGIAACLILLGLSLNQMYHPKQFFDFFTKRRGNLSRIRIIGKP